MQVNFKRQDFIELLEAKEYYEQHRDEIIEATKKNIEYAMELSRIAEETLRKLRPPVQP